MRDDPYDLVYANPGVLRKAGVQLAFATGGASSARALRSGPLDRARSRCRGRIEGDDDQPGEGVRGGSQIRIDRSRQVANMIVTNGDPIDIRIQIKEVFVKGRRMQFDDRHTKEYEQYTARPKPPTNR